MPQEPEIEKPVVEGVAKKEEEDSTKPEKAPEPSGETTAAPAAPVKKKGPNYSKAQNVAIKRMTEVAQRVINAENPREKADALRDARNALTNAESLGLERTQAYKDLKQLLLGNLPSPTPPAPPTPPTRRNSVFGI